jgi:hypothetical protein
MESIYITLFLIFAIPAAFLEYSENACFGLLQRGGKGQQQKQEYLRFRNNYVIIFSLMMGTSYTRQLSHTAVYVVFAQQNQHSCFQPVQKVRTSRQTQQHP